MGYCFCFCCKRYLDSKVGSLFDSENYCIPPASYTQKASLISTAANTTTTTDKK